MISSGILYGVVLASAESELSPNALTALTT
jgi:hypothetical protein